jgi:plasmid stabilization system protein ParE
MPYVVRISIRAEIELDEAMTWIGQISQEAAVRWRDRLLEKVQTLETNPERCALAEEASDVGIELREMLFRKRRNVYRVLFTIDGDLVMVHHIRHAARDRLPPDDA